MNNSFYKIEDMNIEKVWGSKEIDNKIVGEVIKFEVNNNRSNNIEDSLGNVYNLYKLYDSPNRNIFFGERYHNIDTFPFLVKFIYAKKRLSIQVHPKEKKECWLFLKEGKVLLGLNSSISKNDITVDKILNKANIVKLNKYGFAIVHPHTIHSIYEDNVICEVQNNYDMTYRFYDWDNNRKLSKELFIDQASFDKYDLEENIIENFNNYSSSNYNIRKLSNVGNMNYKSNDSFQLLIVLEGNGTIKSNTDSMLIKEDTTYFIMPNTEFSIVGNIKFLLIK